MNRSAQCVRPISNILAVAALLLFAGCLASASKINAVSLGMTKAQVVKIMGPPSSITNETNAVCLNYNLAEVPTPFDLPGTPYEIKLAGDKVVSYGRAGSPPSIRTTPLLIPVTVH